MSARDLILRALAFDPARHPIVKRSGCAVHVLRNRPLIFGVRIETPGMTMRGLANRRVRVFQSTLKRTSIPLLTLSDIEGSRVDGVTFDGNDDSVVLCWKERNHR